MSGDFVITNEGSVGELRDPRRRWLVVLSETTLTLNDTDNLDIDSTTIDDAKTD